MKLTDLPVKIGGQKVTQDIMYSKSYSTTEIYHILYIKVYN